MIQINNATQEQLDRLEVLVNNAKACSDQGNMAFGPLQQQDFFSAIANLFKEPEPELQLELKSELEPEPAEKSEDKPQA